MVTFDDPEIDVDCGEKVFPEPCPETVELEIGGCGDSAVFDAGDLVLDSLGQILQMDVILRNVCPGKRVALAVILTEVDVEHNVFSRGTKTLVIPAHTASTCRDVMVRCIIIVLPEELDVSGQLYRQQFRLLPRYTLRPQCRPVGRHCT